MTHQVGDIWLKHGRSWLFYSHPQHIFQTKEVSKVIETLQQAENMAQSQNLIAVGFVSYEASGAFDSALQTHDASGDFPLIWFGLYDVTKRKEQESLPIPDGNYEIGSWQGNLPADEYAKSIDKVKRYIAQGDTYQVNYTYRLQTEFRGDPYPFFYKMNQAQHGSYSAYIYLENYAICSASPELFFELEGTSLSSKPMKGTVKRGFKFADDDRIGRWLQNSAKNRAENVMIVDMIRNDMSRIAQLGTVKVPKLFEITPYPTLWQMTSTVVSQIKPETSMGDIFNALFPCASITGAPKVRTMQIIKELERAPRQLYCGTIGQFDGQGTAQFNVAIRTVIIDRANQKAEYGVGGGIVWDSNSQEEYGECHTKAAVLTAKRPSFDLLETILWEPGKDYFALKRHLGRMVESADYFGYPIKVGEVIDLLYDLSDTFSADQYHKVRLLLSASGWPRVESSPFTPNPDKVWRLALASRPVDSQDIFLYHKTTHRAVYDPAVAERNRLGVDDVILWNEKGELTETIIGNIALKIDGSWFTPPVESGLLGGTYRSRLLALGGLREKKLVRADLARAEGVAMLNSIRKWCHAELVTPHPNTRPPQ